VLILAIYLLPQTDTVCESYRTLIKFPNRQKVKVKVNAGQQKVNACHDDIIMLMWHHLEVTRGS
jgi:hypothetical protein